MARVAFKFESSSLPHPGEIVSPWQFGSLEFSVAEPGMEEEILSALAAPTLTNVILAGFIRDNGLVSSQNRGRFYLCRNERNKLEGVALIGVDGEVDLGCHARHGSRGRYTTASDLR